MRYEPPFSSRVRASVRASALTAITWLTPACYNYIPIATPTPEPGSQVAVTLTEPGARALASALGPDVAVVRGRYLRADGHGVLVSVSSVVTQRGRELDWAGEPVALPADAITAVQLRQLAKGRSALLVGASVGGLVALAAGFDLIGGGNRPGSGGGGPGPQ